VGWNGGPASQEESMRIRSGLFAAAPLWGGDAAAAEQHEHRMVTLEEFMGRRTPPASSSTCATSGRKG
jgi:ribulose kinase